MNPVTPATPLPRLLQTSSPEASPSLRLLDPPAKQAPSQMGTTVASKGEELRDIYGPVTLDEPWPFRPVLAAILLLAALALLAWRLLQKRKRTASPPHPPPWEVAMGELAEARSLRAQGHDLRYVDRLSDILRRYIESRFAIRSTRQTTGEFLRGLRSLQGESPLVTFRAELQSCLELADLTKFAHRDPDQADLDRMEAALTDFVRSSRPHGEGGMVP